MNTTHLNLYPAVDVLNGEVVRLKQGNYEEKTTYLLKPEALIQAYIDEGAKWLHLVDLSAAKLGQYSLQPLLSLFKNTELHIQTGGGVRSFEDAECILNAGAQRVVIGSLAIKEPKLVASWMQKLGAEHITLALDVVESTNQAGDTQYVLPTHGWTQMSETRLFDLLDFYMAYGAQHILCTHIASDGMLGGIQAPLYQSIMQHYPTLQVQASGGVKSLDDIRLAHELACSGIVLGKALLEQRFTLTDAIRFQSSLKNSTSC